MRGKRTVVALAVVAAVLVACGDDGPEVSACELDDRVTVGVAFSATGAADVYGASQRNGVQLATADLAERYPGIEFQFVIVDDGSDPATGSEAFSSLIEDEGAVALIGPTLSTVALEADHVAQDAGVPVLGVSNTASGITDIGDFVFRDSLTEAQVIPKTIAAAKAEHGLSKVALLWGEDDAFTQSGADVFREALADAGIELVADLSYTPGDTDFSTQLQEVADSGAQALVLSALGAEAGAILVQASDTGLELPLIGGNGFNSPAVLEAAGPAADGLIVGAAWNPGVDNPESEDFVEAYEERFDAAPDQFAAQAFTGARLMAKAVGDACSAEPARIRDALAALKDVPTPLGSFSFTANRDAQHDPVVQVVQGGSLTILRGDRY
jgi:branched-chain amino acid transport system substrate-binding protein